MRIEEFLFTAGTRLRDGDFLLSKTVLPVIEEFRDKLELQIEQIETEPQLTGLEALDDAKLEICQLYFDALDLLELAVEDNIPQLASEILIRVQEAVETSREVRRIAETHRDHLQQELGWEG